MRGAWRYSIVAAWLVVGGCASKQSSDAPVAAANDGGAPTDDASVPVDDASYDLELPDAGTLPLGKADALRIGDERAIDLMSTWAIAADGSVTAVFDREDVAVTESALWKIRSRDGRRFTKAQRMDVSKTAIAATPSFVGDRLYFVSAAGLRTTPTLGVVESDGQVTTMARIVGVDSMLSWPRFAKLADGSVAVAFRDGKSVPQFARSADGAKFGESVAISAQPGAMPAVAEMSDGTLAFSYQEQNETEAMISYFVLSHDGGATWSERIRVSDSANVHDTSFVARADGAGLDVYYIHPEDGRGFSLFRRSVGSIGGLGPEERVTSAELGEPSKPSAARRADGRLMVGWSEIVERSKADYSPTVQQLVIAQLASDAPL